MSREGNKYPFYLGGVSATISAAITHPLDLTKVRMQTSHTSQGMVVSFRNVYREAGLIGLFNGISGTCMRQMSYSIVRFGVYEETKSRLDFWRNKNNQLPLHVMALSGALAGFCGGLAGNPAEIVMTRMLADGARPAAQRYNYSNAFSGLKNMILTEGLGSVLRGLSPNLARTVLMNASQLPSYDLAKSGIIAHTNLGDCTLTHMAASTVASTVATTICSPADVLKSRVMSARLSANSHVGLAELRHVCQQGWRNEGPLWMLRGWLPSWTRLQPQTVMIFVILEKLRHLTDHLKGEI